MSDTGSERRQSRGWRYVSPDSIPKLGTAIWKYHIVVSGEQPRLFIGNREELLDELRAELAELNPDLADRGGAGFWNRIWGFLWRAGQDRVTIVCGQDPIRGLLKIEVIRFLQEHVVTDNLGAST